MQGFEREARYLVAKIRDVEHALTDVEKADLQKLMSSNPIFKGASEAMHRFICIAKFT